MIGQNIQAKQSDSSADADHKINTQAELELKPFFYIRRHKIH